MNSECTDVVEFFLVFYLVDLLNFFPSDFTGVLGCGGLYGLWTHGWDKVPAFPVVGFFIISVGVSALPIH